MSDSGLDKTNIHIDFDLGKVIYTVIKEQSRELLEDIARYLGKNKNEMVRKYLPKNPEMSPLILHKSINMPSLVIQKNIKTNSRTSSTKSSTPKNRKKKEINEKDLCYGRTFTGIRCTRRALKGEKYCRCHISNLRFGDIREMIPVDGDGLQIWMNDYHSTIVDGKKCKNKSLN